MKVYASVTKMRKTVHLEIYRGFVCAKSYNDLKYTVRHAQNILFLTQNLMFLFCWVKKIKHYEIPFNSAILSVNAVAIASYNIINEYARIIILIVPSIIASVLNKHEKQRHH